MCRLLLLMVGALWLGQPAATAAEDLSGKVRQLLRQLNHNQLAVRNEAEQALIDLGPDVLDLLPSGAPRAPEEVQQRLERIRNTLQTAAAEMAAEPTRVTLQGEMTLQEAIQAIEEQTGNKLVGYEDRQATITAQFQQVRFWEALDQVLDQAKLNVTPFAAQDQPRALAITSRPPEELPRFGRADYRGVFRLEATRVEAVRDLRNPQVQGLKVSLAIHWEPRVAPIGLSQSLDQLRAIDDRGQPLPLGSSPGVLEVAAGGRASSVELQLPLGLPGRNVQKIASLQGTLDALLPGRVETFEFTELPTARNVEQRQAQATVVLQQVRKNVDLYELRMRLRFDQAANALQSHRGGWIYDNQAYLIGPDGKRVDQIGLQATRQATNEVGLAYLFDLEHDLAGYKFVYQTPGMLVKMPVKYELKDIELP